MEKIQGIIPAVFSPLKADGSINPTQVEKIVDFLLEEGVDGLYVCGSTGEGPLLSTAERKKIAEAYITAVEGEIPVIIQIGHESTAEAQELARHAADLNPTAAAAVPPSYFNYNSLDNLIATLQEITAPIPELPFYYYHIPSINGVNFDMSAFLKIANKKLPNLAGIKFSSTVLYEFQECVDYQDGEYRMLFGSDEMFLSGLVAGGDGAIGSTFNFAAPLYQKIRDEFRKGELKQARINQSRAISFIKVMKEYGGQPAFKGMMKILGVDCGPNRLPLQTLKSEKLNELEERLQQIGFFEWGRNR